MGNVPAELASKGFEATAPTSMGALGWPRNMKPAFSCRAGALKHGVTLNVSPGEEAFIVDRAGGALLGTLGQGSWKTPSSGDFELIWVDAAPWSLRVMVKGVETNDLREVRAQCILKVQTANAQLLYKACVGPEERAHHLQTQKLLEGNLIASFAQTLANYSGEMLQQDSQRFLGELQPMLLKVLEPSGLTILELALSQMVISTPRLGGVGPRPVAPPEQAPQPVQASAPAAPPTPAPETPAPVVAAPAPAPAVEVEPQPGGVTTYRRVERRTTTQRVSAVAMTTQGGTVTAAAASQAQSATFSTSDPEEMKVMVRKQIEILGTYLAAGRIAQDAHDARLAQLQQMLAQLGG